MSEKEEKEDKKDREAKVKAVKKLLLKIKKKTGGTHNKYDKGEKWQEKKMSPDEARQYSSRLLELIEQGKTPEEIATSVQEEALKIGIISIKVGKKTEKKTDVKEEPEPSPVIDPPNRPLIDEKKSPQRVILPKEIQDRIDRKEYDDPEYTKEMEQEYQERIYRTPEQKIEDTKRAERDTYESFVETERQLHEQSKSSEPFIPPSFFDVMVLLNRRQESDRPIDPDAKKVPETKTKEPTSLLADKSATKAAQSQRKVRMKQKQQSIEEKESIAKTAKQQGRDELIQEMKEGKFKPPQPEGKLSPGIQIARDVIPELVGSAVGIAGGPKSIQKLTQGGMNYIMDWASSFFQARPNTVTVNLPSAEYKLRPIPVGLTGLYKYLNTYTTIYNRLRPEEKKLLQEIDKKLLSIKQSQTRAPLNDKKIKNFYSKLGKTIEKMNTDIKDSKALRQDIKVLEDQIDKAPDELEANFESKQDNRLQLGLGQVMEMKRSGNFLPQLISSSARTIPELSIPDIIQSLNSVIQNITEVEIGAVQRTGDEVKQIPQITELEAQKIKQAVTGIVKPTSDPSLTPVVSESPAEKESETKTKEDEDETKEPTEEELKIAYENNQENRDNPRLSYEQFVKLVRGGIITEIEKEDSKSLRQRKLKSNIAKGATLLAGTYGLSSLATENLTPLVYDTAKNIYNNIMETPITMPVETQAQSDQKISSATGTMRPRFIVPSRDSVIPSMPKIRADDIQFSAFDYVPPGTEGGNGTARTNPLVLSQELEERLRYSNAGITISPGFGENVVSMILTESELKSLLLPRGPDVSPIIYEFPIIDGDQAQNETKRYDQNLIQVEKFSPYNEYNDNDQLDEEVFGSILLSYVP